MSALMKWKPFRTSGWDPFKDLEDFENRLGAFFGRMPAKTNGDQEESIAVADWAPLVDITEDDKEYLVKAELPGFKKEELKVTVESGVLTISGERKTEKEEKNKRYHRVERAYGKFERTFTLPDKADSTKVKAEYVDGVLQLHLPKTDSPQSKAMVIPIT